MKPVIRVENLSKQYRLGNVGLGSLSADINRFWHTRIRGKEDPYLKIGEENNRETIGGSEYVWALRDINFDVQQGEVLGIIGRNGAGKSTLLKILSRTTGPTTGSIKIKGRVASLLEVGTGFHPELTGRENIFLNGAILGMTKSEIRKKFDEIVDFAGVERYVDTPVKRYSSGMYVRLAFAVAAHLEPEILIVDEVLAVGDAEFQKKAIGKMKDVSQGQGRTVLFVSHNMAAVKSLCSTAVLLINGKIDYSGSSEQVVARYLHDSTNASSVRLLNTVSEDGQFTLKEVSVCAEGKSHFDPIIESDAISISIKISTLLNPSRKLHITVAIKDEEGNFVTSTASPFMSLIKNEHQVSMKIPANFFHHSKTFFVDVILVVDQKIKVIYEADAVNFFVNPAPAEIGGWMGKSQAYIKGKFDWQENLP